MLRITAPRTSVASIPTGVVRDVVQIGPAAAHITVALCSGTSLVLTFDNNGSFTTANSRVESGSLSDGYWRLAVGAYHSALTDRNIRRPFGDSTNTVNGTLDGYDIVAFGNAFNSNSIAYDFNNNGIVDGIDLTVFGNRFGVTL